MRAVADRVWYDTANLELILDLLPPDGLDRVSAASGWTVRRTLAHLAAVSASQAEAIRVVAMTSNSSSLEQRPPEGAKHRERVF